MNLNIYEFLYMLIALVSSAETRAPNANKQKTGHFRLGKGNLLEFPEGVVSYAMLHYVSLRFLIIFQNLKLQITTNLAPLI